MTQPASVRDDAARQLSSEATCLAHGGGGALLIGVRNRRSGLPAAVGTDLDPDWLRLRIHEMTVPSLTVTIDPVELPGGEHTLGPILVIRIPPAVELHAVAKADGTGDRPHRWRVGKTCLPMTAGDQASFVNRVRPTDWSAQPTTLGLADLDPRATAIARVLQPSLSGVDDETLLNRLGVLTDSNQLNRAGALLFCGGGEETMVFTVHDAPGAPSRIGRISYTAPLLVALDELLVRMNDALPVQLMAATGPQRDALKTIPVAVPREALANALAHRDWRQRQPVVVTVTSGSIVEVTSPGTLPDGVSPSNILTHPSKPTNPALAHALAVLQVAERQGIGIDLMFREMIQSGHQPPQIDIIGGNVRCRLAGGPPDQAVRRFFLEMPSTIRLDVEVALVVHHLRRHPRIDADTLAPLIQRGSAVAESVLQRLADHGFIERTSRTSRHWKLSAAARTGLTGQSPTSRRRTTNSLALEVVNELDKSQRNTLLRTDVERVLGVSERRARQVLETLVERRWLVPQGAATGRSVRYQRGPEWNEALRSAEATDET